MVVPNAGWASRGVIKQSYTIKDWVSRFEITRTRNQMKGL